MTLQTSYYTREKDRKSIAAAREHRRRRDYDIVDTHNRIIAEIGERAKTMKRDEIFEIVAQQPAKHFYVSHQEAKKNVSLILRDLPLSLKTPRRVDMYVDITILALDEQKKRPDISIYELVCDVINNSPAPSFYLCPKMIEQRYNETIKIKKTK